MSVSDIAVFPITIFKTKVSDNDNLKELLVPKISENAEYLQIPEYWTTNNVKTSFDKEPEGLELFYEGSSYQDLLMKEYLSCIDEIFDKEHEVYIPRIWYNFYSDGEYQEKHDHLGTPLTPCHFSCIHFLSFNPQEHTAPQFTDPLSQLRNLSVELDRNGYGEICSPHVEEGDLLVFPSYLMHSVLPCSKTDYPRITLSFNIRVLKYGND